MVTVNKNYLKLPGSYLFSTIAKKVAAYQAANPDVEIVRLGIGDVTQPLVPAIIDALHKSVDEMANAETFHGYAPDLGYEFLRSAIAKNDYEARGCQISADEIFVSDGAKSDSGNIQEIFGTDNKVAVCDPVYPVYVDTNVMAGRTGEYNKKNENFDGVIYMPVSGIQRIPAGTSGRNTGSDLSLLPEQPEWCSDHKGQTSGVGRLCKQERCSDHL